jgi:hypothetical protein
MVTCLRTYFIVQHSGMHNFKIKLFELMKLHLSTEFISKVRIIFHSVKKTKWFIFLMKALCFL